MPKPSDEELQNRFRYHPATHREITEAHQEISELTLEVARRIAQIVPNGRGLSCALTALEEVRMWANQGIATDHAGFLAEHGISA